MHVVCNDRGLSSCESASDSVHRWNLWTFQFATETEMHSSIVQLSVGAENGGGGGDKVVSRTVCLVQACTFMCIRWISLAKMVATTMLACLCYTAHTLLFTCVTLDSLELLFTITASFVVWSAALLCCIWCGIAFLGLGPRLFLLCRVACRVVPLSSGQAHFPRPDPGVGFQLFVNGVFSVVDCEFVTVRGSVTGHVRFVSNVSEREFVTVQG